MDIGISEIAGILGIAGISRLGGILGILENCKDLGGRGWVAGRELEVKDEVGR